MMPDHSKDFVHPELDKNVKAIGGEYVFINETVLSFHGREVLYLIGCAVFDTTCCGTGGVCYAYVPGFIHASRYRTSQDGRPVSRVVTIVDPEVRDEIRKVLSSSEMVHQVEF